ncbi:MAG: AAA family ATPase [Patescibacteria group bacterium]|nr:AAA family ATPase [Patescibacteria group bacterium]
MKCEKCRKKEARFKLTKTVNGKPQDQYLCEDCLEKVQGGSSPFSSNSFPFGDLFGDFFGEGMNLGQGQPKKEEYDTSEFFSERLEEIINQAKAIAAKRNLDSVDTEELLLASLNDEVSQRILNKIKPIAEIKKETESFIKNKTKASGKIENLELAPRARKSLEFAYNEAYDLGHSYVGPEHLLLGLSRETDGIASQILNSLGITYDKLKKQVHVVAGEGEIKEGVKSPTPHLDQFSRDLTRDAKSGKLDPVIGRENEIETTMEVLSRRTKNNPVLIGEPGVGKTAIVEGLATRIAKNQVPHTLQGKRVVALDISAVLAGTQYRGQFEERLKQIIDEIRAHADSLVIFIDELHTIVGAGSTGGEGGGAMDAANMLKPALARGELHLIGATTLDEYRKYIEKDAALERRLQPVLVPEPTLEDTILILKGLKEKYESHHKVKILDEALVGAAELSDRYVSNRFLPDKAIDLIDQAAARVTLKMTAEPQNLQKIEEKIKGLNREVDQAASAQDFRRAAVLKKEIKELEAQKETLDKKFKLDRATGYPVVSLEEVAEIVARQTGIPVSRLQESEKQKLLDLEKRIHGRLIGQAEAVKSVSEAIRRARVGLKDRRRPIGSFLFLGPTGVGKTELARTLAETMFGDEDALIRLDMSEYMEKHSVSRLVGAPPGYVGYDEGGQLTESVRRKPYAVILFDEIEKAHPDVFNILLQILDDGVLTDGQGRKIDFKNCLIILTSNLGSEVIKEQTDKEIKAKDDEAKRKIYNETRDKIEKTLGIYFKPEFLNRLDETILFHNLTQAEILQIVDLQIELTRRMMKGQGLDLEVDQKTKEYIANKGYDPAYGARPLRRLIQNEIENKLAGEILQGKFKQGDRIKISIEKGELKFHKAG